MSPTFQRALAVGTTAALVFLSLFMLPAQAAPSATPTTCAGVWVVVQTDQNDPASTVGCATTYATGLDALQSAGFATVAAGGMLSQIEALPTDPNYSTNGGYYWSYWHATVSADGSLGTWSYYTEGPAATTPTVGVAEGYLLTNDWNLVPGATKVIAPAASTSASVSISASASTSVSPSASIAATGSTPASAISAAPTTSAPARTASVQALAAAAFVNGNLPTADDGADALINAALGLSAVDSCAYASTIRSLIADLKTQAADFVGENPGRAAKLAILASAVGENPDGFGGLDLLGIVASGTQSDGQVGEYASSFVQAYAVIAYVRAGQPAPDAVLANLLSAQDSSGAFGYVNGGSFTSDYDTTGLAIQALHAAGGDSAAIARAVAWAASEQTSEGYWPNPYSPVDSTGLLGSGLVLVGSSTGGALAWLVSQQVADGGFPAALGSTTSNLMATTSAIWMLTGTSVVTVSFRTTGCTSTVVASPAATATTAASLADTGMADGALQIVLIGALVVVAGLALVASRRKPVHA